MGATPIMLGSTTVGSTSSLPDRPAPRRAVAMPAACYAAIFAITIAGAVLRLMGARGDLWLDEIWSFRLLEHVHGVSDILFALPYDNNHVVTSLWLYLVGPQASPILARLPSIVFGALCAPVAARIGARLGIVAAIAAASVFAFDYVFVHYGSEARGYSGMILAILVALDALLRVLDDESWVRNIIVFALAIGFGTLSHLTMVEATAVLGATATLRVVGDKGWRIEALAGLVPLAVAALGGTAVALVPLAISLSGGIFHTGIVTPFSLDTFATGLTRMVRATAGLPDVRPSGFQMGLDLAAAGIVVAAGLTVVDSRQRPFLALAILGLPLLNGALRLPNQQFARFHLTVAVALGLLAALAFASAWRAGRARRGVAIVLALGFLAGQAIDLTRFLISGRGQFSAAVTLMAEHGPASFMVRPRRLVGETNAVIRWYARPANATLLPTDVDACAEKPDWLVMVRDPEDSAPEPVVARPDPCAGLYHRQASFPAYGLSGFTWILYRKTD